MPSADVFGRRCRHSACALAKTPALGAAFGLRRRIAVQSLVRGVLEELERCLADMYYGIQVPPLELLNMGDGGFVDKKTLKMDGYCPGQLRHKTAACFVGEAQRFELSLLYESLDGA